MDPELSNEEQEEEEMVEEEEEVEELLLSDKKRKQTLQFKDKVKRMCVLDNRIKEINSERKVFTDEKTQLKKDIMDYMASNKVGDVTVEEDVLYLDTKKTAGSLTRKTLKQAIMGYFDVKGVEVTKESADKMGIQVKEGLADADELFTYIQGQLGETEKVVLIKEKKSKGGSKKASPKILSVYT